jgi:hypothetical protein
MRINKIYLLFIIIIIGASVLWVSSCRHESLILSTFPEICFEKEVLPIFKNNCSIGGCHDGTGETDLLLNDYVSISHSVVPGNPNASRSYQTIIRSFGENKMPPSGPIPLESRTLIRLWIEQGAKLTICPDSVAPPTVPPEYINPKTCFSRDILPVLISTCAMTGCHDAISHKEGYVFASYSSTMNAVRPGNTSSSKLYQVITITTGESRMPPSPKPRLAQAQIDSIAAWIRRGALDEYCGETCDTINTVTFSKVIWPTIQSTCTGCHSGTSPSGAVSLTSYANVQTVAASGLLMKSLNGAGVPKMPPSGSLSTCKKRQFQIWVNNGYLNN